MYLEHFGLTEPPFRITPITVFFFSGANRGEILDALIYSLSEAEGIIKVSGEVGSGKTMLCRMLLERLPDHVETIYLANPSLSREEMLYAIADGLGLNTASERVGVIMSMIQNKLEEKAREGKRIVVLVDEAHAMPLDTLEELRLLYNLQVGDSKLLQIVLFGQPELNTKLNQPNMRQLKDRIVHHFHMQPLSRNILESYLMFRMRAAGYKGPDIFSPAALKLLADTSNGLMRRVNILADKSLLAAFVEDTYYIKPQHVQAAIRDSELSPVRALPGKKTLAGAALTALVLLSMAAWWMMGQKTEDKGQRTESSASTAPSPNVEGSLPAPVTVTPPDARNSAAVTAINSPVAEVTATAAIPAPAPKAENIPAAIVSNQAATSAATPLPPAIVKAAAKNAILFEQRLAAGKQLLEEKTAVASIQLFYKEAARRERIEGFLMRADALGKLPEIYLLPARFDNKDGLRVLYGAYPSIEAARNAIKDLPPRYQEAFATSIYIW